MNCPNCGAPLVPGSNRCRKCGGYVQQAVPSQPQSISGGTVSTGMPQVAPKALPAGLAITGMILGIASLAIICLPVAPMVLAVLAVVFSSVALKRCSAGTGGGKGMAIVGLICGLVTLVADIISIATCGVLMWDMW